MGSVLTTKGFLYTWASADILRSSSADIFLGLWQYNLKPSELLLLDAKIRSQIMLKCYLNFQETDSLNALTFPIKMLLPLIMSLVLGFVSTSIVTTSQVSVCIMNCGQCKMMLGPYFKGPACAQSCLATFGKVLPDCNNPYSVKAYLKRLI